jgi:hypothetical protein
MAVRQAAWSELFEKLSSQSDSFLGKIHDLVKDSATDVAGALTDIAMGTDLNFGNMVKSMTRRIIQMAMEVAVVKPIFEGIFGDIFTGGKSQGMGAIGSAFPGIARWLMGMGNMTQSGANVPVVEMGFGGASAGLGDWLYSFSGHMGRKIGTGGTGRNVPASLFENAPRHHSGTPFLGPDEVPFIGKRGETVLTQEQMASGGGGGGVTINAPINITMQSSGDAMRDGEMVARMVETTVRTVVRQEIGDNLRVGGAFNPT